MASPSASTSSDDYCLLDYPKTLSLPFRARSGTDQAGGPGDDDVDSDDGLVYVSRPESVRSLDTPPPNSPGIIKQNEHVIHDDSDTVMADQPPACQSPWKQSGFHFYTSYDYHPQPKLPVPGAGVLVPQLCLCPWPTASERKPNSDSPQIPQNNSGAIKHILPTCDDHRSFDTQIMDRLLEHALRVRAETCLDSKTPKDKRLKEQMFDRLLHLPPDHPVLAEIFRHTRRNSSTIDAWQNYDDEERRKYIYGSIFTDVEKVALWWLTRTHAEHFAVACVFTDISVEPRTGPSTVSQDSSLSAGKQLAMEVLSDCLKPIEICNLLALRGYNELRKCSWTQMIAKTRDTIASDGNDKVQQFDAHFDLLRRGEHPLCIAEGFVGARAIREVFMTTLQTLLATEATANPNNPLHGSPQQACARSAISGTTILGEYPTRGRDAIKRGASSTDFAYEGSPTSRPPKRPNLPLTATSPKISTSATTSTACNPRTYSRWELCEKLPVSPELRHEYLKLLVQKMGHRAKTTSTSTDSSPTPISEGWQDAHKLGSVPVIWPSAKDFCPLQGCTWSNPTTSTENTLFHVKTYHPEFSRYLFESVDKALKAAQGPAVLYSSHPLLSQYSAQTARDPDITHPKFSGNVEGMLSDGALVEGRENAERVSQILDDCIRQHGLSRTTTRGKERSELPTIPYHAWKNMLALEDYQVQLMLLEEQNKKRLQMRRNMDNTKSASTNSVASKQGEANAHRSKLEHSSSVKVMTDARTKNQDYEMQLKLLEEQNRRRLSLRRKEDNHDSRLARSTANKKDEVSDHHVNPPQSFSPVSNCNSPVEAQDYQKQLQLLEQQNKKRLLMARSGQQLDKDTIKNVRKRQQQASIHGARHFQQTVPTEFQLDLASSSDSDSRSDYEISECGMHQFVERQDKNTLTSAAIHRDEAAMNSTTGIHIDGQYRRLEPPQSVEAAELQTNKFGVCYPTIRSAIVQHDEAKGISEDQAKFAESLDALKMIASMCPTDLPVWRYHADGVLWLSFTTCSRGMEMEYTIRADVESVNVDILTPQFKVVHRLTTNKPSVCPMGQLCGEDNCLFSASHRLRQTRAWQLASLNPLLRNNSALLAEATARYFTFRCWYSDRKSPTPSSRESQESASINPLSYEAQLQLLENQCRARHRLARQEQ